MKFVPGALKSVVLLALGSSVRSFGTQSTSKRTALLRTFSGVHQIQKRDIRSSTSSLKMSKNGDEEGFTTWTFDNACGTMEWNNVVPATLSVTTDSNYDDADLVIVGIRPPASDDDEEENSDEPPPVSIDGVAKEIDDSLGGALTELLEQNAKEFKNGANAGSATPTLRLVTPGSKSKRYVVVGLGAEPKEGEENGLGFKLGAAIGTKCDEEKKVTSCSVILPESLDTVALKDLSTSMYSTLYSDNRYRNGDKIKKVVEDLTSVNLILPSSDEGAQEALDSGKNLASGVFMAKDIVNAPHNVLNSESLADTAKRIAADSNGTIECQILGKAECEERGMGAYLGVARGSETEPQFIHLTYKPKSGEVNKKVGVVGKGLLFDTGGYNIKTQMMELMKFDCGGSAAVLGAARAVGALEPEGVEAHFIVAACENMINDKAVVPSDVLTASNGMTIEVKNTDAEGRLTLADALVFADKEVGCESIIELSTLTGACMISLGKQIAGMWTDSDDLAKDLEASSKVSGDKIWRMPMAKEYNEQLESKIADISNLGTPYGGAITAALFLQNFVDKKKPFAHIDIAGPVWDDKIGATGHGAKLVAEWVSSQGAASEE